MTKNEESIKIKIRVNPRFREANPYHPRPIFGNSASQIIRKYQNKIRDNPCFCEANPCHLRAITTIQNIKKQPVKAVFFVIEVVYVMLIS